MQIPADPDYAAHVAKFDSSYAEIMYGKSLAARVMRAGHRLAEKPFPATKHFGRVLEVGSGNAEHIGHVVHSFDEYVLTDRSTTLLSQAKLDPVIAHKVTIEPQDATKLTYADNSFDRLIGSHVLEHLPDPHAVVREWARVVKPDGVITVILPCDPGLAWALGRNLGVRKAAGREVKEYDYWVAREHINSIQNLTRILAFYFTKRQEAWWPMPFPATFFNLFYIAHLSRSDE